MIERFKLPSSFANYQSYRRQLTVLASLGFATALCLGLLALRAWHYGGSARTWLRTTSVRISSESNRMLREAGW